MQGSVAKYLVTRHQNKAEERSSVVLGGTDNIAAAQYSSVAGGSHNKAKQGRLCRAF